MPADLPLPTAAQARALAAVEDDALVGMGAGRFAHLGARIGEEFVPWDGFAPNDLMECVVMEWVVLRERFGGQHAATTEAGRAALTRAREAGIVP